LIIVKLYNPVRIKNGNHVVNYRISR